MNASEVATLTRREALVPNRRGLLRTLLVAGAGFGARVSPVAEAGRKRCKKVRRTPAAPPTCAESCPASCTTCYQRSAGPVLCGGSGSSIDCAAACSSDNDCVQTSRPYCTHSYTDRASGDAASWSCPGNPPGVCTYIDACGI